MVAYTKPQQRKKEESERPRSERDQIKLIDLRIERQIGDLVIMTMMMTTITMNQTEIH